MKSSGPPIDRGWAWVVLIATHTCYIFSMGYIRSFGILFVEFLALYQESSSLTALILGIQGAMLSIAAFLAQNVLSLYLSTRVIVMTGGFLVSLGIALSTFASGISFLIFTQSLLVGSGCAFVVGPAVVFLGTYFVKHRSLAISVAYTGSNVGTITMPLLIRYLIDEYNVKGAFLIFGGASLHIIVCGALLRPMDGLKYLPSNGEEEHLKDISLNVKEKNEMCGKPTVASSESDAESFIPKHRSTALSNWTSADFMDREFITLKYASAPELASVSVQNIPTSADQETEVEKGFSCTAFLDKTLDFSLFKKTSFYLLVTIGLFGVVGGAVMGIFVPALAADVGATKYEATIVLSVSSAAGIVSRLGVGFFADRNIMKRNHILALALLISGASGLVAPLYNSFWNLLIFSLVYGFFGALYFPLIPMIVVDVLGMDKLAKTFGFLQLVHGASYGAMSPLAGWIRDLTGDFVAVYIFFGATCMITTVLLLLLPCTKRIDERNGQDFS